MSRQPDPGVPGAILSRGFEHANALTTIVRSSCRATAAGGGQEATHDVLIEAVGVWDTVDSVGTPFTSLNPVAQQL